MNYATVQNHIKNLKLNPENFFLQQQKNEQKYVSDSFLFPVYRHIDLWRNSVVLKI